MEPKLAQAYNGLLGMGWSLEGLPSSVVRVDAGILSD